MILAAFCGSLLSLLNLALLRGFVIRLMRGKAQVSRFVALGFLLKELGVMGCVGVAILKFGLNPAGFLVGFSLPVAGGVFYGLLEGLKKE
jgi:hypothetical protein